MTRKTADQIRDQHRRNFVSCVLDRIGSEQQNALSQDEIRVLCDATAAHLVTLQQRHHAAWRDAGKYYQTCSTAEKSNLFSLVANEDPNGAASAARRLFEYLTLGAPLPERVRGLFYLTDSTTLDSRTEALRGAIRSGATADDFVPLVIAGSEDELNRFTDTTLW